jgi:Flp pilus assembly pilin Flp
LGCLNRILSNSEWVPSLKMWRFIKILRRFVQSTTAAQLVEEGLLLCMALVMLTVMLGVVQNVLKFVGDSFSQSWRALEQIAQSLFGWIR